MKKLLISVMVVVMMIACLGCFAACGDKTPTLVVGITDYEPMDYQDANGNWIGFDADLANQFGKENGYNVKFQIIDWDSKTVELNSGNIDLIWNGMTADDGLGQSIDFSVAYATNMQCAVVLQSSSIATVADLAGKTIAVEKGSAGNSVANDQLSIADKDLTLAQNQVKALLEVKSGNSDVALVDYTMAYSIVGKNDYANLKIVDINSVAFNKEVFAVGVKKGDSAMQQKLNAFFAAKYADGTLATLAAKYSVALNEEALNALK